LFNCFYAIKDPRGASSYNTQFSLILVGWNVLYNLGFIYTDVKKLVTLYNSFYDDTDISWSSAGNYLGDFLMRFVYSRFIPKAQYIL
jgi:hypothetical protein